MQYINFRIDKTLLICKTHCHKLIYSNAPDDKKKQKLRRRGSLKCELFAAKVFLKHSYT